MVDSLDRSIGHGRPRIAAIGASAGGITALQALFEALPARLPYALVVLQHLPPGQPSALADLVAGWTAMPVYAAVDGTRPASGCVYLPSPDHVLTLEDGILRTRPCEGGRRRPGIDTIDAFLESVALDAGARPVAVILSGTGMDGTAGATCIRQAGGIVIVQDPLTALHDGMPNAVMQRGLHDHVLPVAAIGRQLLACASPDYLRPVPSAQRAGELSETLEHIIALLRRKVGFDLSGYKPSPLLWRIQQRMDSRKVWSFDDYAYLIDDDPVELEALVRGIPIHVTGFFRDAAAWDALRERALLPLVDANVNGGTLRFWTPACATGEEAYSVAMSMEQLAGSGLGQAQYQIFATDAAPELVAQASRGVYRGESLTALTLAQRKQFFYRVDSGFRVKRFLREKLVFVPQNLISDAPFPGLDLITCRNLLIYLRPEAIRDVLSVLNQALRVGGYLFLGKGEPYPLHEFGFEPVERMWNIYRKVLSIAGQRRCMPQPASETRTALSAANTLRLALEQYDVPSVLVDSDCLVLRIYGNLGQILSLPAGAPTLTLPELVPRQWAAYLRNAIRRAFAEGETLTLTQLYDRASGERTMRVRLTPLQAPTDREEDRLLVSFIRAQGESLLATPGDALRDSAVEDVPDAHAAVDWHDEALASREELDASREELQALNEELKASNDLLNESNQDLNSVNARLKSNNEQLALQRRVLLSGEIRTLYVDRSLALRWFTPATCDVFPLVSADIGRNIGDLVPALHDDRFLDDIRSVLRGSEPREVLLASDRGGSFLRKVWPSAPEPEDVNGVAITYIDVTDRVRAEHALRRTEAWLSAQNEAFQAAMNGATLKASLQVLIRTLIDQADDKRRCAFYIADGDVLRHVVGMSDDYATCVDGFRISPESLACGLAVATGTPVITRDVLDEPRWRPWTWLAQQFGYRGCWSFPVETADGRLVGSLAMYFSTPREPTPVDRELAGAFTQTAGVIISRHLQSESAKRHNGSGS